MNASEWKKRLDTQEYTDKLAYIYACEAEETKYYKDRLCEVIDGLEENFGKKAWRYS